MSDIEYEELAAHLLGVDIDDDDVYDSLDNMFYQKYEMDLDDFQKITSELLRCIRFGKSALTDETMVGFGKTRGNLTEMFVKMNYSEIDSGKEKTSKVAE